MSELLTQAEHNAVTTAALLANQIAEIIANGPSRDADLAGLSITSTRCSG